MKVGIGYDVHALVEDRPLILGGVTIPYCKGLAGHSDADVLIHTIMDALLGALGIGDIGTHFPDTDQTYKGADSLDLLGLVFKMLVEEKYVIGNIDAIIIAEKPKMAPYIETMKEKIADVLQIENSKINIKATTEEGLGFTGKGEGIACKAICLIEKERISK
ncbi:2-C-methyl-D-erythritol 2,4-cyclodiphosphate synthase [endosymbiont 'TC1' of Trimyema compressum]|uniref:2-C-methyl-D-erythritol 2,4-cyclodiphosphate synthase n=1 Tax=endosymbiont 'TC1' of Trimyema compressum TaxID=243899 RepID=UPI0007F164A8|nr:2-C-methyl-D-erythritol 2,4-cyclodiphosphate synthase [endosymbiont 'TC1' of Trimyema compressum]AMP21076.1 2-C-methyl-D-erythritol 2,4-cyclodiphosphate synthase [endosymbiont 'TC1' of Trimyema compressum]